MTMTNARWRPYLFSYKVIQIYFITMNAEFEESLASEMVVRTLGTAADTLAPTTPPTSLAPGQAKARARPASNAFWEPAIDMPPANANGAPVDLPFDSLRIPVRALKASPTEEDMKEWAVIKDTYPWAGFKEADFLTINTSLMEKLALDHDDVIEDLASVDPDDFKSDLSHWEIDGMPAASGWKGKARQMYHAARVFIGKEEPVAVSLFRTENDKRKSEEMQWYASQPKQKIVRTDQPSSSSHQAPLHRRVNVKDIADETRDQDIELMSQDDITPLLARWRYETRSKKDPPEDEEPSAAQLSYLAMCQRSGENPQVNMGFWGPFGDRLYQRVLSIMWMLMPDGGRLRQKFLGPPTIQQWVSCWLVFQCGMIMLGMADYNTMRDYMEFIKGLVATHGAHCWAIIYQAEARMRRNGLELIKRQAHRLLNEIVAAEADGAVKVVYANMNPNEFNPKKPWDFCFRMAIFEESPTSRQYWKKYVEQPCNDVNYRNFKVSDFVDKDCQIAATPEEHIATGGLAFNNAGILPRIETGQPAAHKTPKLKGNPVNPQLTDVPAKTPKLSQQDQQGNFTHNNKGVKLCPNFNSGKCKGKCSKGLPHQCSKCLQNSHVASLCGQVLPKKKKNGKA